MPYPIEKKFVVAVRHGCSSTCRSSTRCIWKKAGGIPEIHTKHADVPSRSPGGLFRSSAPAGPLPHVSRGTPGGRGDPLALTRGRRMRVMDAVREHGLDTRGRFSWPAASRIRSWNPSTRRST
jgi:hypothetical protein